jgi:hypothetical protein
MSSLLLKINKRTVEGNGCKFMYDYRIFISDKNKANFKRDWMQGIMFKSSTTLRTL